MRQYLKNFRESENFGKKLAVISVAFALFSAFAIVMAFYYRELYTFISDSHKFRAWIDGYGNLGEIVFVSVRAFQTVIKIIPAEPLEIGAGYVFGTWWGFIWCMVGTEIGSAVIIILTKLFGTKIIHLFVPKSKIESLEFLHNTKKLGVVLFIIYLIPGTPKDIITYLIGLTPMKLPTFLILTGIARIPSIITSTMCGEALGAKNWAAAIIIYAVTAVFSVIGIYVYKWYKKKLEKENNKETVTE